MLLLAAGLVTLRTGRSTLSTTNAFEGVLQSGKLILLEIYSDF